MTDQLTTTPIAASAAPPLPDRPRIYVACLAAYNNGRLHGRWIDATTPDEIWGEVRAMLAASDFDVFSVLLRETARGHAWDMESMFGY